MTKKLPRIIAPLREQNISGYEGSRTGQKLGFVTAKQLYGAQSMEL